MANQSLMPALGTPAPEFRLADPAGRSTRLWVSVPLWLHPADRKPPIHGQRPLPLPAPTCAKPATH